MSDKLVIFDEVQHKVLKIRIYPSQDQTILINKTFGSCRKLYNEHLQERNEFYIDSARKIPPFRVDYECPISELSEM